MDERRYTGPPARLEFGVTVWCPRCKGKGTVTFNEKTSTCPRCDGYKVVPNVGIVKVAKRP
jgi:DnaJ-class molecular chaperone